MPGVRLVRADRDRSDAYEQISGDAWDAVVDVAGQTDALVAAPAHWLNEHGVQNWSGPTSLPLWLDDPEWYGMNARVTSRARAAGLICRPLEQTLADTLAWELSRPQPHGAGLTDEEERDLLNALNTAR